MTTDKNPPDPQIFSHHVGGRGLTVAFNYPRHFDSDVIHILYEADAEAARAMNSENTSATRHILPFCLGRDDGDKFFYKTANRYASSLLPPSPDYNDWYCEVPYRLPKKRNSPTSSLVEDVYDAIYGIEYAVEKKVPVKVRSLDSLFLSNEIPGGVGPDFLSLDTQGSEYDILLGAKNTIADSVLGVATEIEFHRMYDGQPLFSDILDEMDAQGFHFAGFLHLQDISPFRAPLGFRSPGFTAFGDALFLRKPETLRKISHSDLDLYVKARKLAFISVAFERIEFALSLLTTFSTKHLRVTIPKDFERYRYLKFLDRLEMIYAAADHLYLPTSRLEYAEDVAGKDFNHGNEGITTTSTGHENRRVNFVDRLREIFIDWPRRSNKRIRDLVFTEPHLAIVKIVNVLINKLTEYTFFRRLKRSLVALMENAEKESADGVGVGITGGAPTSCLEELLSEFGFFSVAASVKSRRLMMQSKARSVCDGR